MPSWFKGWFDAGAGQKQPEELGPQGKGMKLAAPSKSAARPAPKFATASTFGKDTRVEPDGSLSAAPWCAVCHLACKFPNHPEPFDGTGFLIDATTIITAGHNLWNPPFDPREPKRAVGAVENILVVPGNASASYQAERIVYDERWQKLPDPERRYFDYGAIFLGKPGIALPFYFKCFPLLADKWVPDMVLNCAGYPSDKLQQLVTASGKVNPGVAKSHFVGPDKEMVVHDIDTKGGQSGAPIFWTDQKSYYALAIHTQGVGLSDMNAGVRITEQMIKVFDHWRSNPKARGPVKVV